MFEIGKLPTVREADRLIENVPRSEMVLNEWGNTKDIMNAIMGIVNKDELEAQVKEFALEYYAEDNGQQIKNLQKLWALIRHRVRYIKDPEPYQYLKHPVRTWKSGIADCKSLTMLYYFCLRALDIPSFIRFASYTGKQQIGHVYNVAVLDGQVIPIDLCLGRFGVEEKATKIIDRYTLMYNAQWIRTAARNQRNASLNGIGSITPWWVNGGIAGLLIIRGFKSESLLEKIITFGLGGYYLKQTFAPGT